MSILKYIPTLKRGGFALCAMSAFALGVLILGKLVVAQDGDEVEWPVVLTPGSGRTLPDSPLQGGVGIFSTTLGFTLSSAADGGTSVWVSTDGNVLRFFSPNSPGIPSIGQYEHMGNDHDGYVLCYSNLLGNPVQAYGSNWSSSGFAPPSPPSGTTISRNTSDGLLKLAQTFTLAGSKKQLTIKTVITNQSGGTIGGITFRRHAKFNADIAGAHGWATVDSNFHSRTSDDGVISMNQPNYAPPSKKAHGMEIVHIIGPAHVAKIVFFSTAECSPISQTLVSGNYASTLEYNVGTLAAGMAKTIQLYYARF